MVDYLERLSMEERTTRLEALVAYVIEPFLSNNEGILTLEKLVLSNLSSIYSDTNREACRRVHPNNLTYLPTIQTTTSMDLDTTPIRFLTTYLRLVHLAVVRLKSRREMIHRLLRNAYLKSYFRAFIKHGAHSVASDLITNRDENLLVYNSVRVVFYLYNLEVPFVLIYIFFSRNISKYIFVSKNFERKRTRIQMTKKKSAFSTY